MDKFKFIKKEGVSKLPKSAGVYALCRGKEVFYIGKAVNIRQRVKNHFQQSDFKNAFFIGRVSKIGIIPTDSEIEALILEAKLIKKHKPKYNVVWRDDKNFFYVGITKEDCPTVFITHQIGRQATGDKRQATYIGPFVEGRAIKKSLRFLRKIFPYYSMKKHPLNPCPWCQLKLCPGPNPDPEKYGQNIRNLTRVLTGKSRLVLKSLFREMKAEARQHNYEKAAEIRDQVRALERVLAHAQIFAQIEAEKSRWIKTENKFKKILKVRRKISRIEAYDISNIQGQKATGSMVTFIAGYPNKNLYRKFRIKTSGKPNDIAMIKEVLQRRFKHLEWGLPGAILIDGGKAQLNTGVKVKNSKQPTMNIKCISLAKKQNKLYVEGRPQPLWLKNMPREIFNLILHLRDEAHRFAISYHKSLRKKELLK